ncbi:MAG: synthase subunit delta [Verrucomicrobiaceae bacterium]|nr:synthase subunit delta [Verrucomicrobiaceae bacterium]
MAEWVTLARPYANAAFNYADELNALGAWSQQLALAAAVAGTAKVRLVISSPSLTAEQQASTLIALCGSELSAHVGNFIRALAANKRLLLLPQITELFEQLKANRENSVDVEIASAFPLSDAVSNRLAQALRGKLQREVTIKTVVDKSLLGGVLVRSGDVVIDGSVRGRLEKLAKAMNS